MQAMQQLTGINFIFYFGNVFFTSLGTIKNPFLISLATSLVNMGTTPVSFYIIEKYGRRTILIYGAAFMVVFQVSLFQNSFADFSCAVRESGSCLKSLQIYKQASWALKQPLAPKLSWKVLANYNANWWLVHCRHHWCHSRKTRSA